MYKVVLISVYSSVLYMCVCVCVCVYMCICVYTYTHSFFIFFSHIGYYKILNSSLCYIVGPCWLSILYIVMWRKGCQRIRQLDSITDSMDMTVCASSGRQPRAEEPGVPQLMSSQRADTA